MSFTNGGIHAVSRDESVYKSAYDYLVPLLIVETFAFGIWIITLRLTFGLIYNSRFFKQRRSSPILQLSGAIGFYMTFALHWGLSLQGFRKIFHGITRAVTESSDVVTDASILFDAMLPTYFLPFITETALFGVSTTLFAFMWYLIVRRSGSPFGISIVHGSACVMYLVSVAHWAVDLAACVMMYHWTKSGEPTLSTPGRYMRWYRDGDLILITFNIVLSDAIVLWRMWLIWGKGARVLILATLCLSLTAGPSISNAATLLHSNEDEDSELHNSAVLPTFGSTSAGMITSISSTASNFTATSAIAYKAWQHRKLLADSLRCNSRKTMAERIMVIMVESGAVYFGLWILWIVTGIHGVAAFDKNWSAVDHMNTAMAQVTVTS
ncbi:hypothetical protein PUNSTDRAFT_44685 [Punctularia strigosozonata HHB-11173 SS5]|uniref:uncharacterized protein n=1 Tax=Punctularia strigosozonata (strain HHB-11173) TaxID=741275 RepID=UPI0004417AC3|nr:uncharacterized protein PUNSTDRAFT_44685 [Punctularia strigosozonata HHB-11173 SS5]EIN09315.1 hypothetical protein PUNSTDRAFT_44685 [Punctularia strigosozonata HHB-11173 SS5]